MNNYTRKWSLEEKGFVEVPFNEYTKCQYSKLNYVEQYLSPSIQHSNCGWHHATYYVLKNKLGIEEYVALYPEKENANGRYINVSGNSLGAIAIATWSNVFN